MTAITRTQYRKLQTYWWKRQKVRSLREIRNGNYVFPAGTLFEITDKYGGFSLRLVETCEKCGIGRIGVVSHVGPESLELMPVNEVDQNG